MNADQHLENQLTLFFLEQEGLLEPDEYENLNGLGFVHKKSFKRFRKSIKRTIKNPGSAIKRRVKRVARAVKKVAPYAAAGAAIYFGAPYALKAAGFLGAKAKGLGSMIAGVVGGGGGMAPGQMGPPAPASSMMSPEVLQMGGQMALKALRRQGIRVQSPQGQQMVQQYVDQTAYRAEQNVTPGGTGLAKMILPAAAIGVGTVLMLKG